MSTSENVQPGPGAAPGGRVSLTVHAADPATEIFVVDGAYQLVGRGVGSLARDLPAGLYKLKLQTGPRIHEQFVRLEPGQEALLNGEGGGATLARVPGGAVITCPPMQFASAVPLANTGRTHEYQLSAAEQQSRVVHVTLGAGSQVYLFVRRWTRGVREKDLSPSAASARPRARVSLRNLADEVLVDLETQGARDRGVADPWMACNVALDPGLYRLRMTAPDYGTLETMLVASPGWQTQVFLYRRFDRDGDLASRPNLAAASVFLRRLGVGFDAHDPDLRLTELARAGLRNRRSVISRELVERMLQEKQDNPMLGLYGCYLWLLAPSPDLELIRRVVESLRGMLGRHPDVEALALAAGLRMAHPDLFAFPPMLLRSWPVLVKATLSNWNLIPPDSLAASVADRLFGEGPLLVWRQDGEDRFDPRPPAGARRAPAPAGEPTLEQVLDALAHADPGKLEQAAGTDGLEAALALQLLASKKAARQVSSGRVSRRRLMPMTPDALVKALGVPRASLDSAARGLERRVRSG